MTSTNGAKNMLKMRSTTLTIGEVQALLDAFADGAINLSEAAEMCGVKAYDAYNHYAKEKVFADLVDAARIAARERVLDLCERKFMENINNGDNTAMIFYSKTIGRQRGFNEKIDVEHTHNVSIDMDEAARRIAFAMNQAISNGVTLEGQFTEVVPLPATKAQQKPSEPQSLAGRLAADINKVTSELEKAEVITPTKGRKRKRIVQPRV